MRTVSIVAPVLFMLILGMICKKTGMINQNGIEAIKKYITNFALPVTIFHAIATVDYGKRTIIIFILMLAVILVSFAVGFLLKHIIREPYRKYVPFLMTIYEGGMLAYPLYQNLCGSERMSQIAVLDIAGCFFGFSIYFGLLELADSGSKISVKKLALNAVKSTSFIGLLSGLLLGLLFGITGIMNAVLSLPVGEVYISVKEMITAPLSAMILLCVGYDFSFDKSRIGVCVTSVIMRFLLQGIMLFLIVLCLKPLNPDPYMLSAFVIYIMSPPSFCMTSFVKNEEASQYIATTTSLYCLITIAAYIVTAILL